MFKPTALAFGPDGWLYAASLPGGITALKDLDGNFIPDTTAAFVPNAPWTLGMTFRDDWLYACSTGRIVRYRDSDGDHVADIADTLVTGIPFGQHQNNGLAFRDDTLYVTVGSESNIGTPTHPWSASILRFLPDGTFVDVHADGIRNAFDLAFHASGALFACDNGPTAESTWVCYEAPDELNWIRPGQDYGFPECNGLGDCAPVSCTNPPCGVGDCQWGSGCDGSTKPPIALFDPHSSPDGLTFATGFPGFDGDDLFVAEFGQDIIVPDCVTAYGRRVVHTRLTWTGSAWSAGPITPFLTDIGRPLDVVVGPDGGLYVSDIQQDTIWRVAEATGGAVDDTPRTPRSAPGFLMSPNPARTRSVLVWTEAPGSPVTVSVHDVRGRTLTRAEQVTAFSWDLKDPRGARVAPGLYWVRVQGEHISASSRMVVLD